MSLITRCLRVVAWLVIGLLALVTLFRLVAWDDIQLFAMVDAFMLLAYLPAWVIALGALAGRNWRLAVASLGLVVTHLVFVLPELTAASPVPASALHAPSLTLFDANVYQGNPSMAGYATLIRRLHPDLVTLEEASPVDRRQLERAGALTSLPHVSEVYRHDSRSFLIASRFPLGRATVSSVARLPFLVRTTLQLPNYNLPLWVVHTTAPVNPGWQLWSQELDKVDRLIRAQRPRPLLMVGDFNATWGNRGFRSILATGLTDAAAARGEPLAMTWSQEFFLLPPLVRIDHVLTSPGVVVTDIRTGPGPGSDHRGLIASVAVLGASSMRRADPVGVSQGRT